MMEMVSENKQASSQGMEQKEDTYGPWTLVSHRKVSPATRRRYESGNRNNGNLKGQVAAGKNQHHRQGHGGQGMSQNGSSQQRSGGRTLVRLESSSQPRKNGGRNERDNDVGGQRQETHGYKQYQSEKELRPSDRPQSMGLGKGKDLGSESSMDNSENIPIEFPKLKSISDDINPNFSSFEHCRGGRGQGDGFQLLNAGGNTESTDSDMPKSDGTDRATVEHRSTGGDKRSPRHPARSSTLDRNGVQGGTITTGSNAMLCSNAVNGAGGGSTSGTEDGGVRGPRIGTVVNTECPTPTQAMERSDGSSHSNEGHISKCHIPPSNQVASQLIDLDCLRTEDTAPMDRYEDSDMEGKNQNKVLLP